MSDILKAARSYYGLADTHVRKTDIYTNEAGQPMLVFELALSAEDFIAISERMQKMQQFDNQPDTAIIEGPTVAEMRHAYNSLSSKERGKYKSFARYVAESSGGIVEAEGAPPVQMQRVMDMAKEQAEWSKGEHQSWGPNPVAMPRSSLNTEHPARQVVHVDAPEELEPVSMDAVWLSTYEATDAQKMHCIDTNNRVTDGALIYLVQWAMLTDEQKQKAKEAKP